MKVTLTVDVRSLSGDCIGKFEAESHWTGDEVLDKLRQDHQEHRICTLTHENGELLLPCLSLTKCGLETESIVTAVFWTKAGFEAKGLGLRALIENTPGSRAIRHSCFLRSSGYSLCECRCSGYSVREVKEFIQSPQSSDLLKAGEVGEHLKDAGFTAKEMHSEGYTIAQLRCLGFSLRSLYPDVSQKLEEIRGAGFTLEEIFEAGFKLEQLQAMGLGLSVGDLKRMGWSVAKMQEAGFTARQLKMAGFTLWQLKDAGVTLKDLKEAGYSAWTLMCSGFKYEAMSSLFSKKDLVDAGYTTKPTRGTFKKSQVIPA